MHRPGKWTFRGGKDERARKNANVDSMKSLGNMFWLLWKVFENDAYNFGLKKFRDGKNNSAGVFSGGTKFDKIYEEIF